MSLAVRTGIAIPEVDLCVMFQMSTISPSNAGTVDLFRNAQQSKAQKRARRSSMITSSASASAAGSRKPMDLHASEPAVYINPASLHPDSLVKPLPPPAADAKRPAGALQL